MQPVSTKTIGTNTPRSGLRVSRTGQLDFGLHNPTISHVSRTHASAPRASCSDFRRSHQNVAFSIHAAPQRQRPPTSLNALPIDGATEAVQQLVSLDHAHVVSGAYSALAEVAQHASLAYERVTLPCSSMNCGDAIYRRSAPPTDCCSKLNSPERPSSHVARHYF